MKDEQIDEAFPQTEPYPWLNNRVGDMDRYIDEGRSIPEIAEFYGVEQGRVKSYLVDSNKLSLLRKKRRSKVASNRKQTTVKPGNLEHSVEGNPKDQSPAPEAGTRDGFSTQQNGASPMTSSNTLIVYHLPMDHANSPPTGNRDYQDNSDVVDVDYTEVSSSAPASADASSQPSPSPSNNTSSQAGPQPSSSPSNPTPRAGRRSAQPRGRLGFWQNVRSSPSRASIKKSLYAATALGLTVATILGGRKVLGYFSGGSSHNGNTAGIVDSTSQKTDSSGVVTAVSYQADSKDKNYLVKEALYGWTNVSILTDRNGDGIISEKEGLRPVSAMYKINTKFDNGTIGSEMRVHDGSTLYILKDRNPVPKGDVDFRTFDLDTMVVQEYGVDTAFYTAADLDTTSPKTEEIRKKFSAFDKLYRTTLESKFH